MRFILIPLGTRGDVNPFLRIGAHLAGCGHDVTVMTTDWFRDVAAKYGLPFEAIPCSDVVKSSMDAPALWHPRRSFSILMRMAMELVPPVYGRLARILADERPVVVTGPMTIGARIAREQWRFPLITLCLQPVVFGGALDMPRFSGLPGAHHLPLFLRKRILRVIDMYADHYCCPPLNAFRRSVGLDRPVKDFLTYWLSDQPVLALFPDWFGTPGHDWFVKPELMGFPLEPVHGGVDIDSGLRAFIASGPAPLVCTFGTGMLHGAKRFKEVIGMCKETETRAVLIGPDIDQLDPALVPETVYCSRYADFPWLLPRCRMMIHHGGIGTTAECIRAGIPQLIMPMAFDQPDNASRIARLGLGDSISPRFFRTRFLIGRIGRMMKDKHMPARCRDAAGWEGLSDGIPRTARRLIELGGG